MISLSTALSHCFSAFWQQCPGISLFKKNRISGKKAIAKAGKNNDEKNVRADLHVTVMKHRFWLIFIYCVAHLLICFISGQWWDDWCYWINGADHLKEAYLESGMPLQAYNILSVMWLPNWGYRTVVFFLFLLTGLLFYETIRNTGLLSDEEAFWAAAVSMTVPANDARVILNCFGYSLALFLFMLAFFIVTKLDKLSSIKKISLRVLSLLLLFYSYTTQSLLVFTGLIWLYFLYKTWQKHCNKNLLFIFFTFIKTHWDYLLLPIVYYIIKVSFFRPYGDYEGYNNVTLDSLISGTIHSPFSALKTMFFMIQSYLAQIGPASIFIIVLIITLYLFTAKKESLPAQNKKRISKKHIIMLFLGIIVYYAGLFAYIIVRYGSVLSTTGVTGRDTLLACFGIGIMVVALCRILPTKNYLQNLFPIILIILGAFHFNDWYLNYQEDWYHQQEVAYAITQNNNFDEDNTILCDFSFPSPVEGTRFYSINGISYMVTGKMDKFYFSKLDDLNHAASIDSFVTVGYNCDEYDPSDKSIDGVLLINNTPIGNLSLIKMRYFELFEPEKFQQNLAAITSQQYIKINKTVSDSIYEAYNSNALNSDILWNISTDKNYLK